MVPLGALRSEIYLEMSRGGRLSAPFLIVRSYVAVLCEELGSQLSRTSDGSLDVYGVDELLSAAARVTHRYDFQ